MFHISSYLPFQSVTDKFGQQVLTLLPSNASLFIWTSSGRGSDLLEMIFVS